VGWLGCQDDIDETPVGRGANVPANLFGMPEIDPAKAEAKVSCASEPAVGPLVYSATL
jgi:hypothetical protein